MAWHGMGQHYTHHNTAWRGMGLLDAHHNLIKINGGLTIILGGNASNCVGLTSPRGDPG